MKKEKMVKEMAKKNELLKEVAGMKANTPDGFVIEIVDARSLQDLSVRFIATNKVVTGVSLRQFNNGEITQPVEFGMTRYNEEGDAATVTAVDKAKQTLTLQFKSGRIVQNMPIDDFKKCMFETPKHAVHTKGHLTDSGKRGIVTEMSQEYDLKSGNKLVVAVKRNTGTKAGHEAMRDNSILGARRQAQSTGEVAYVIDNSKGRNNLTILFISDEAVKTGVNKTKFLAGQFGRHSNVIEAGCPDYPAEMVEKFFAAHPDL